MGQKGRVVRDRSMTRLGKKGWRGSKRSEGKAERGQGEEERGLVATVETDGHGKSPALTNELDVKGGEQAEEVDLCSFKCVSFDRERRPTPGKRRKISIRDALVKGAGAG